VASIFYDSFDHYNQFLQKWSSGVATFNTNPAFVRTGTQSLTASLPGFPNIPRINFANRLTVICGYAFYPTSFGANGVQISRWYNQPDQDEMATISVLPNGSVLLSVNTVVVATSTPGALSVGEFAYIEVKATLESFGAYEVRINGSAVSGLVGNFGNFADYRAFATGADGFMLIGSDVVDVYYDDAYLLDDSGTVNNDFLGAVQIFAILPDANETPLNFTPLAGTNFSEVNQVPPPGDSAYVFDDSVGAIDQYHYTITGPSGSFAIKAIQHSLCARLDSAGSHAIASRINTHTGSGPQVGTSTVGNDYAFVIQPWDLNPNTGLPFQPADFSTTFVGPIITS